ncbi:MAG: C13 family peptidase [Arenicella sp.]
MKKWISNLWQGMQLSLLLPVKRERFYFGNLQIVLLVLSIVAIDIISDYWVAGDVSQFNAYGISNLAFYLGLYFVGFFFVGQLLRTHKISEFVLLSLSGLVSFNIGSIFYRLHVLTGDLEIAQQAWFVWMAWGLMLCWMFIIIYRACRLAFDSSKAASWITSVAFTLFVVFSASAVPEQPFFYASEPKDEQYEEPLNVENVYYQQAELMQNSINQLQEHRANQKDLYLVTFASYGYQDVFMKEVAYVQNAFEERYGHFNQVLSLINHEKTIDEFPLANKPNLALSLNAVRQRMNPDDDAVMIYLTSHGSKDARLSASLWPLEPNSLDADGLKEILDESGIKWRIVIVSACYSGSFIEPLQDENTLIITASAKDRTSFGCSNDRELTYFAEAFFQHAWPQSSSLLETFEIARTWVTQKETKEGKENSKPQVFIGERMKQYLRESETEW